MIGGQARSYFVRNAEGEALFLKMFMEPTALSEDAEEFRQRQATLVRRLDAIPLFVCRDIEFFEERRTFYKVSERINGDTLQQKLDQAAEHGAAEHWPQDERRISAAIIAYALIQLHGQRIAHLDLKPDNILLQDLVIESTGGTRPVAKLVDFDGAFVDGTPRAATMGTQAYMSPEHVRPGEYGEASYPADVFQLGIILYQLLARRHPFTDPDDMFTRAALHPCEAWPALPQPIGDILWRALSPLPEDRPTVKEFHAVLLSTRDAKPEPAPEPVFSAPPTERLALLVDGRKFRFWKDDLLQRSKLRGIAGYEYLSDPQARLFPRGGGWSLTHANGATNPTRVNGAALAPGEVRPLLAGDVVSVGPVLKLTVAFEPME
ncbi:MAG: protein kinase [Thermomicrobiales bacterium]